METKFTAFHWPDHNIGKRESRAIREAHNALYNSHAELLEALQECITSEGATCFGQMDRHPEWMQQRLYAISDIARAAIAKALGE